MSYEDGIPVNDVERLVAAQVDLQELAQLIAETFATMTFQHGFVHSDPHPGNLHVRVVKNGMQSPRIQLVLLDHGIYTRLSTETRLAYTQLWRALITQNDQQLKKASEALGCPFYELFASVIVQRRYSDIMNKQQRFSFKKRLGTQYDGKENREQTDAQVREDAMLYANDILEIFNEVNRDLLLVIKTNNYLRTIDQRLGSTGNTIRVVNRISWQVYRGEVLASAGKAIYS